MDLRILYLTLSTLQVIHAYCSVSEVQCTYILNCVDQVDVSIYEFQNPPNGQYRDVECQPAVTYNGHHYYNVEFVFEQSDVSLEPSLSIINVSSNKLKTLPLGLFKNNILNYIFTENNLEGSLVKGMLEHVDAEKLDFSYERLTEIQNYAFYNLTKLKVLLLNSNRIKTVCNNSFETLINLVVLNLSDNQISNLNFNKKD
ncbi:unnamed protein product [Arctia plantaginis]|uniref:Uncharacterized protein n=1 Tax=Arctia plantaginis TaxID=874455 RepID=A0A8S1AWZ4_ARCPL|nr:unnamed protein product [Arctia plantaginis]